MQTPNRRRSSAFLFAAAAVILTIAAGCGSEQERHGFDTPPRPNILLAISDDQSWLHTGIEGDPIIDTPNFDRIAAQGIWFRNGFCASPSCSPSRAAILTGRHIWRLGPAANLMGAIPDTLALLPDLLEEAGYHVGYTGKGWAPGAVEAGRRNPAGPEYNERGEENYIENFQRFLEANREDRPFFFWFGSYDPHAPHDAPTHRPQADWEDVPAVPFLPPTPEYKRYMYRYYAEVQRFDGDLGKFLQVLEARGMLDNTIVVVTSDNGVDLPRGKINLYDYGTHVPLALRWGARVGGERMVEDLVSLTDLAPTFLELAGGNVPRGMTGRSLVPVLLSSKSGHIDPSRDRVYFGRERHSPARAGMRSYPSRAIRTHDYLYIRNFAPKRWPAGDPPIFGDSGGGSKIRDEIKRTRADSELRYFELCYGLRPLQELYDLEKDPDQLVNVALEAGYEEARRKLWRELRKYLQETGDPRVNGDDGGWDTARWAGGWREGWDRFKVRDRR